MMTQWNRPLIANRAPRSSSSGRPRDASQPLRLQSKHRTGIVRDRGELIVAHEQRTGSCSTQMHRDDLTVKSPDDRVACDRFILLKLRRHPCLSGMETGSAGCPQIVRLRSRSLRRRLAPSGQERSRSDEEDLSDGGHDVGLLERGILVDDRSSAARFPGPAGGRGDQGCREDRRLGSRDQEGITQCRRFGSRRVEQDGRDGARGL